VASSNPLTPLRRLLTNPPALLGLCIALDLILAVVRAHTLAPSPPPVLRQFASTLDEQYHECVPLGWFPDSRPWRGYFPGFNADVAAKGVALEALWVGLVPARTLDDPQAVAVKAVLDEFTRLGLLVRHELPGGVRYNLTRDGLRYYYERNDLGNNVESWPYLCFSRLHARDVAWSSRPSKGGGAHGEDVTARIRFTWEPRVDASWATPFVKAHAVELNPTSNPAEATARRYSDGEWGLTRVDFSFPLVEDPSAWTIVSGSSAPNRAPLRAPGGNRPLAKMSTFGSGATKI
jgi:hypothetical protein